METKLEILQLREELQRAGYEYYVLDTPTMSDFDYDHKLRRLEELEDSARIAWELHREPDRRQMLIAPYDGLL